MIYDIILRKENDRYIVHAKYWPEVTVVENSRDVAIDRLKSQLLEYLTRLKWLKLKFPCQHR